ncbi:hypothetical protein DL546_002624 [Coniochaeta pulveracea]|uniref:Nitrogen regulatory protein areA GATA-like domain-containing protein n=1 Tax=Coniochaeta pulveracea TaxID=177199 RepID=A0A420Y2K6_9PEZI|nr:hypothetical protein DL546_002624 [Coniochaeta pulveracea]
MAVVLSSEENDYFASSMRRTHSQPKLNGRQHDGFHTSTSGSRIGGYYNQPTKQYASSPSSGPSSPTDTLQPESADSWISTPASNFSIASSDGPETAHFECVPTDDQIFLPQYDDVAFSSHFEDLEEAPSPHTGDSYLSSPNEQGASAATSRPDSPALLERAEDDIHLKPQPSRHVDYLSHNWREEDIWESWKLIVSKRGEYSNSARLENASWRTWMKSKHNLQTVSPETLNWFKDCDVTWLYGPLQSGSASVHSNPTQSNSARLSKSNSFVNKKPILKKRSMSELMLQRSLSTSSLVKQAAAAVQAQQNQGILRVGRRPGLERSTTDYLTFPFSSLHISRNHTNVHSASSSGAGTPGGERKHIHFNEQVVQCIAIDVKGEDEEDDVDTTRLVYGSDSDDDDGGIVMKKTNSKKRRPVLKRSRSSANSVESKTIAMLPSTTLKYREDTPEPAETAMKHSTSYRSPVMSPSSSQETLKPSKPSRTFSFADEDSDEEEDEDDGPVMSIRSGSRSGVGSSSGGFKRSSSSSSLNAEPTGMRRTASGMFMPYEEGEEEPRSTSEGLFGRVIDTVNTARDIAHVIWNVGWRR